MLQSQVPRAKIASSHGIATADVEGWFPVGILAGGLGWARNDQCQKGPFRGCPRLPVLPPLLRLGESRGLFVLGPGVQGVPAYQAHQCRERLLQVGQVCEAGGKSAMSDGLLPVLLATC